jgi:hypothetical protein
MGKEMGWKSFLARTLERHPTHCFFSECHRSRAPSHDDGEPEPHAGSLRGFQVVSYPGWSDQSVRYGGASDWNAVLKVAPICVSSS